MKYKALLVVFLVSMTIIVTNGALFYAWKMNPVQTKTKADPWMDLKSK